MLRVIRRLLLDMVDDIDTGNSNVSEDEQMEIIKALRRYTRKDDRWNRYQAYTFLNISRATFDRYVRDGIIPKGRSVPGYKELFWLERDIRRIAKQGIKSKKDKAK